MSQSGRSRGGKLALEEAPSGVPHKYHDTIDALREDVTRRQVSLPANGVFFCLRHEVLLMYREPTSGNKGTPRQKSRHYNRKLTRCVSCALPVMPARPALKSRCDHICASISWPCLQTTRMHSVTEQIAEERMGQLRSVQGEKSRLAGFSFCGQVDRPALHRHYLAKHRARARADISHSARARA
mgnify:CR=1 FL=1